MEDLTEPGGVYCTFSPAHLWGEWRPFKSRNVHNSVSFVAKKKTEIQELESKYH